MSSPSQSWLHRCLLSLWYGRNPIAYALWPLTCLFNVLAKRRRQRLQEQVAAIDVPVIIIGNINVGGTGKTPVVIALAQALSEKGIKVGIVSRGYGSQSSSYPIEVKPETAVKESGDEALLIAQSTACPVVVDRDRVDAANYLLSLYPQTQVIISDDGLQHYRLPRSMEIVVIDGSRGLGNGLCLPAGPLREPPSRLKTVDWVLINGEDKLSLAANMLPTLAAKYTAIELKPKAWQHVQTSTRVPLMPFPWLANDVSSVPRVIAAIGNPQRFFHTIDQLGLPHTANAYDDHYEFSEQDAEQWGDDVVLMTSKDAVKCHAFAKDKWWSLVVTVDLSKSLIDEVVAAVENASP